MTRAGGCRRVCVLSVDVHVSPTSKRVSLILCTPLFPVCPHFFSLFPFVFAFQKKSVFFPNEISSPSFSKYAKEVSEFPEREETRPLINGSAGGGEGKSNARRALLYTLPTCWGPETDSLNALRFMTYLNLIYIVRIHGHQ